MCKYCNFEPNGDCPDDRKYLIDITVSSRLDINLCGAIFSNGHREILDLDINCKGNSLIDRQIKIKYCPMCGRKLNEKK